jgi:transcriptional regulator with XRE-family HTH domain
MLVQLTDQEVLQEIARRLKSYRLLQNVSADELARRAGLSKNTVVNAEAGRNPTLRTLVRMLRGLGKLSALEAFLPEPQVSPIQLLERGTTRPRKHAYPKTRS